MKERKEEEIRAFIAIDLSPSVLESVKSLQDELKRKIGGVRWVKVESIHLTLKFLGNINEERATELCSALAQLSKHHGAFNLAPSGIGAFPRLDRPRVVWLGLEGDIEALNSLYRSVEESCFQAGLEKEKRALSPHLTLGRVKDFKKAGGLDKVVKQMAMPAFESFRVDEFHLYRSELRPEGAHYTKIKSFPLTGKDQQEDKE